MLNFVVQTLGQIEYIIEEEVIVSMSNNLGMNGNATLRKKTAESAAQRQSPISIPKC